MKTNVLIAGAGPVGLTIAAELARFGIPFRIVDKAAQRTDKSKALVLWSRTLELLDHGPKGSAPFVEVGFKARAVNFVAGDGELMGRVTMDSVQSPYSYGLMLPQSETERLLEERLQGLGVPVERQVELLEFKRTDTGVEAILRHGDGREKTISANWLLGCDGAHSVVRHVMAMPFAGETLNSDWMLADVHMKGYPFPDSDAAALAMVIYAMALPERYDIACGAEVIDPMSKFVVSHVQGPRDEALIRRLLEDAAQRLANRHRPVLFTDG